MRSLSIIVFTQETDVEDYEDEAKYVVKYSYQYCRGDVWIYQVDHGLKRKKLCF